SPTHGHSASCPRTPEPHFAAEVGLPNRLPRHYPWGATTVGTATSCVGVSCPTPRNMYSEAFSDWVARQYCHVIPLHRVRLTPCSSRSQLRQPPVFHTEPARSRCSSSLYRCWAAALGASACAPYLSTAAIAFAT